VSVDDRKLFQQALTGIGVEPPYHIGYHPNGSYSYVDSKEQLGIELSVNDQGDYGELLERFQKGAAAPLGELT
jgi:methylmalonyl-CoA/ethylmalonyl-CoA epimerase